MIQRDILRGAEVTKSYKNLQFGAFPLLIRKGLEEEMKETYTYCTAYPSDTPSNDNDGTYLKEPLQENCMDANIPAPYHPATDVELTGRRTVIVTELVSMTKYLFDHYRLFMYSHLNRCLRSGALAGIVGFRFCDHILNRNSCSFGHVSYWRLNRESFLADVEVNLHLKTGEETTVDWKGYLCLWFNVQDTVSYGIESFGPLPIDDNSGLQRLDRYLIPYYTNQRVDMEAELIWNKYYPAALTYAQCRNAAILADRMNLTILPLSVYQADGIGSMIFFREGTLLVNGEMENGVSKPHSVKIEANTIVLNTNIVRVDYSAFDIFHECFHYEYHYLFYRLQEMGNNDTRQLKTKEIVISTNEQIQDPIYFMEKQANRGAYGLMLPATATRAMIERRRSHISGCCHAGQIYQIVGQYLSNELRLPHFRIRARMIQLGYLEAKGALNYADKKMIDPFAFSLAAYKEEKYTFVIDSQTAINLAYHDSAFREVMSCGKYIYADGHIVLNNPRCVYMAKDELKLTPWANAHVDECCLRFVRYHIQNSIGKYVFGHLNYDVDYIVRTQFYLEDLIDEEHLDELDAKSEFSRRFPRKFHEAVELLLRKNDLSIPKMAEMLNMDRRTLERWLHDSSKYRNEDFLTMICLALQLPDWISRLLFKRANVQLDDEEKRHQAVEYILRVQSTEGIEAANSFLKEKHLCPLSIA